MRYNVPLDWKQVNIGEVTQQSSERNGSGESDFPVLSVTNSEGFVNSKDYFAKQVFSKDLSNYKIVRNDQFAYNPSRINVGSLARLKDLSAGLLSPMYVIFHTLDAIIPEYLEYWLNSSKATIQIKNNTQGTVRDSVSYATLSKFSIDIPPLPEQNKIATILSNVDDAIQATQAVIDQTRTVKQGLLQHLLTHGIGHTRFKQTEIGEIPEEWDVRKLRTVAHIQTGIAKGKKYLEDTIELPYLRVANVQEGYIDITEIKTINVSKREVERYSLQEGDVLLTEGGDFDKLGRGDVWHGQIEHCLHQNHVFAVRTDRLVILPEFYSAQASSFYGKKYFLSCAKQTTNLASINSTQLKDFPTIVPPLEEQNKIIKILYSVKKEEGLTKEYLDQLEKIKRGLMQDLLTGRVRVKLDEVNTT